MQNSQGFSQGVFLSQVISHIFHSIFIGFHPIVHCEHTNQSHPDKILRQILKIANHTPVSRDLTDKIGHNCNQSLFTLQTIFLKDINKESWHLKKSSQRVNRNSSMINFDSASNKDCFCYSKIL